MKQTVFLIVNAQSGDCRLRRTPSAGPTEYVFQVDLEIPDNPVPVVTIKIPVPAAPAVVTEIKNIPFGVPWAISEGIVRVTGLSDKGAVILDYTDEGLARLYKEAGGEEGELEPWDLHQYAKKNWGLPLVYLERDRFEKLLGKKEAEGEEGD
ncbi:unnamed protein product [marine sediment metagenome]|uniref:Uncharacterized protein n=1 Tax=marine sediment metagenome TaxID=412755 RepID=X1T811_9ZZZZ